MEPKTIDRDALRSTLGQWLDWVALGERILKVERMGRQDIYIISARDYQILQAAKAEGVSNEG